MSRNVEDLLEQVDQEGVRSLSEEEYLYLRDRDLLVHQVDLRQREVVVNPGDVNSLQALGLSDGNTHGDRAARVTERGGLGTFFEGRTVAVAPEDAVGIDSDQERELEEIDEAEGEMAARRVGFDDDEEVNDLNDREQPEEPEEDVPYDQWDKGELQAEARDRGLATTGNKRALVERLNEHDARLAAAGEGGEEEGSSEDTSAE